MFVRMFTQQYWRRLQNTVKIEEKSRSGIIHSSGKTTWKHMNLGNPDFIANDIRTFQQLWFTDSEYNFLDMK